MKTEAHCTREDTDFILMSTTSSDEEAVRRDRYWVCLKTLNKKARMMVMGRGTQRDSLKTLSTQRDFPKKRQ